MLRFSRTLPVASLLLGALAGTAAAQADVQIRVVPVASGVHMLVGAGGNIGVSTGPDGTFLVDDQYAPLAPKIRAALESLGAGPVRFVLNTHWHFDHTGGNEDFGGTGALIVAHENVRARMSTAQVMKELDRIVPPSPTGALPVVTFTEEVTFHLNGDELHAIHVPPAHTDGDAIVHWRRANVIHMGDIFFAGLYPFIDLSGGGTLDGVIGAVDVALGLANDATRIIPGHGPLASKADLQTYRTMLGTIRERFAAQIAAGKSLAEVKAMGLTREWDEAQGKVFITPDKLAEIVYADLSRRK